MVDSMKKRMPSATLGVAFATWIACCLLVAPHAAMALPGQVEEQTPADAPTPAPVDDALQAPEVVAEEAAVAPEPATEVTAEVEDTGAEEAGAVISITEGDQSERPGRRHRRSVDKDTQIHVSSDLVIREDEVARDAIVLSGSLDVRGKVIGDAVCILGSVTIEGQVTGEVVAVGGSVYLGPNAEVMGDVLSVGGSVEREPGSRILGQISEIDFGPTIAWPDLPMFWRFNGNEAWDLWHMGAAWSLFWTLFKWVLLVLLTSLVFLVAREPVERTSRQIRGEFWKSSLVGLVAIVFFPFLFAMVIIVLAITIIGIPLLIVIIPLSVMLLIFALLLGYTAAAYSTGNWLGRRFGWSLSSPYLALLVGVLAIQSLSLMARLLGALGGYVWFFAVMFGLAGWCVRFVAWTSGFGAALLTQLGRREPAGVLPAAAAVAPAVASDEVAAGSLPPPAPPSPESGESEPSPDESD